jgi:hypothetical protein
MPLIFQGFFRLLDAAKDKIQICRTVEPVWSAEEKPLIGILPQIIERL